MKKEGLNGATQWRSSLGNIFFVLAKNPAIWAKLRAEVETLQNRPPTYEELRGLKYVQCCVNECMDPHNLSPLYDLIDLN